MNSVTLGAAALRNSIMSNLSHALHSPQVAADSPATGLDTPSPGADDLHAQSGGSSSAAVAGADAKRLARRVMPARLRRVSNILTGSILEEEMAGAAAKEGNIDCTPIAYTGAEPASLSKTGSVASQQIETPEFRMRDDSEVMGKTRSLRSQEDTSDAAYERRHRKADNAEKRLRRWEKENLKKDRQKIVERMEQLKNTDVRTLAPILTVREQRERQHALDGSLRVAEPNATGAAAAAPADTDLAAQQAKLEHLRDDLLDECKAVLRRYDALLTVPMDDGPAPSHAGKRKKPLEDDGGHTSSAASAGEEADTSYRPPRRTISVSGAFARKSTSSTAASSSKATTTGTAKANGSALRASASTSSLPDASADKKPNTKYSARDIKAKRLSLERTPRPFTETDGSLRAEHTYANIHARTSGGRFAPKVALVAIPGAAPASRSKINTKTGRAKAVASETQRRKGGRPRKSEEKPSVASTSATAAAAPAPARRPRGRPSKAAATDATASPEPVQEGVRTRRVKLILNRGKARSSSSAAAPASVASSASSSTISTPTSLSPAANHIKAEDNGDQSGVAMMDDEEDADGDVLMDSEGELDAALPLGSTPARSVLTLEEAQALLMKAMEDGEDEDAMDAAAAAATMIPSREL